MRWGIDLSQPSTQRGIVWLVTCVTALLLIILGHEEAATTTLATGGTVAGTWGMVRKD